MSSLSSAALSNVGGSNQHSATTTVSSIVSSSSLVPSVTGIPTPSVQHRTNEKLIIIIVSCVGGFVVVLVTVLLVVPFSRRYFARRRSRQLDGSSSQHSSARSHQRSISGPDASVPLLESEDVENERKYTRGSDLSNTRLPFSGGSSIGARLFSAPDVAYPARSNVSEQAPSRSSRAQPPLRRTRTRILPTQHMDTLPEDATADPTSVPAPSPTLSSAEEHPSWLHVPDPLRRAASNIPLIGAFRKSFSSSISSHSSLPPMQHYPSFNAASPSRSRSPETFYSMSTGSLTSSTTPAQGHSAPMSVVSEYGEVAPPPARLKPAGGMERVPQQVQPAMHHPASRQASFANGHVSASLAGWRLSDYPTNASASTMSVYTDARSRLASDDSEGEGVDETMRRR